MNLNTLLFSFITFALFTNVDAANQKRSSKDIEKSDTDEIVDNAFEGVFRAALESILEQNPALREILERQAGHSAKNEGDLDLINSLVEGVASIGLSSESQQCKKTYLETTNELESNIDYGEFLLEKARGSSIDLAQALEHISSRIDLFIRQEMQITNYQDDYLAALQIAYSHIINKILTKTASYIHNKEVDFAIVCLCQIEEILNELEELGLATGLSTLNKIIYEISQNGSLRL
jgi:hypothetical protein